MGPVVYINREERAVLLMGCTLVKELSHGKINFKFDGKISASTHPGFEVGSMVKIEVEKKTRMKEAPQGHVHLTGRRREKDSNRGPRRHRR